MGWAATSWALKAEAPTSSAKLVLLVLAAHANERGASFPSLNTIMTCSQLCGNTVRASCRALEEAGLLFIAQRFRADGGLSSNEYVLLFSEEAKDYAATLGWKDRSTVTTDDVGPGSAQPTDRDPRGTRLPAGWRPDEGVIAFGVTLGFPRAQVLGDLLDEFTDYWRGVPGAKGRKADWPATFRNSLRKSKQHQARAWRGRPAPRRNPLFEDLIAGADRASAPFEAGPNQPSSPTVHRLAALEAPRLKRIG